jgi:hypothetical protein
VNLLSFSVSPSWPYKFPQFKWTSAVFWSLPSSTLNLLDDNCCCMTFLFKLGQKISVGRSYVTFSGFSFFGEKVLRQELQPSFGDGLLTCCGLKFFLLFVGLTSLPNTFWQCCDEIESSAPIHDMMLHCDLLLVFAREHELWTRFRPEPIFLSTFYCFTTLLILR